MLSSKLKVLFMVQLPPPTHGPALRNQSLIKSEYINRNIDIKVAPLQFSLSIKEIGKFSIVKYVKVVTYSFALIKLLFTFRPPIVYFTISPIGGSFVRDCLFVFILKLFRVKRIFHLRGLGIRDSYKNSSFYRILYKWAFRNSFLVFLSEGHKSDVCFKGFKESFVIPNGIEDSHFVSITEKPKEIYNLLFFSNLVTTKGLFIFIDAVEILLEKGYPILATISGENGDVSYEEVYDYICKKRLNNFILVMRGVYGEDKFKLISGCDIFVFPTFVELFPGVILEAMQCGKAIVSTTTGAIAEIIDNRLNGLLTTEKKNPKVIADLVEEYIQNPSLISKYGLAAREKYENNYTIDKFERNMLEMLNTVNKSI